MAYFIFTNVVFSIPFFFSSSTCLIPTALSFSVYFEAFLSSAIEPSKYIDLYMGKSTEPLCMSSQFSPIKIELVLTPYVTL